MGINLPSNPSCLLLFNPLSLSTILIEMNIPSFINKIKLSKCHSASNHISFLGYILSPDGLHTDPENVRAVTSFPVPLFVESLRSFLGLAGYYRCFISRFSQIAAPLTELLKQNAPWV